jgi:hypothetical protein
LISVFLRSSLSTLGRVLDQCRAFNIFASVDAHSSTFHSFRVLDPCRAFDLFASVVAHLFPWDTLNSENETRLGQPP